MNSLPTLTPIARVGFHRCFSVYPHNISKSDTARITKLDIEMFHDESWKAINWGSRSWVTKTLPAWVFALLWALACSCLVNLVQFCFVLSPRCEHASWDSLVHVTVDSSFDTVPKRAYEFSQLTHRMGLSPKSTRSVWCGFVVKLVVCKTNAQQIEQVEFGL